MESQSKFVDVALSKPFVVPTKRKLTWRNPIDQKIYQLLKKQGPLTRGELVERTGLPRTTLYDALTRLSVRGLIVRFTEPRQSRGRRRVFFEVATSGFS
ncbi:MAG: helix-turn-helix domain-containing protein [Candidatus Thorarchaeota archaeon]